jgi:hypothetical protein
MRKKGKEKKRAPEPQIMHGIAKQETNKADPANAVVVVATERRRCKTGWLDENAKPPPCERKRN